MGRPKADLAAYSPWGAVPISAPVPPNPAWLPVVSTAAVYTWGDLAMWALARPEVAGTVSLFTNFFQPTDESTLADFTSPTAPGLLPQLLPAAIRNPVPIGRRATWTWPTVTFAALGGGLPVMVWGYYVYCTDPITAAPGLLWAQRLVNPWGFVAPGDSLPIPLAASFGQC